MTPQAQLPGRPVHDVAGQDHPTDAIGSSLPIAVDPFHLLDHRTRKRLIAAAGAPAGRYLSFEHDGETWLIALRRSITHVGRGLVADLRLEDPHVSRRHAILAVRGDGARVLDDRSYNGTFVNGRRITVQYLADGDVLRCGRAVFRFTEIAPRGRPEPVRRIGLGRRGRNRDPEPPSLGRHHHPEPPSPAAA